MRYQPLQIRSTRPVDGDVEWRLLGWGAELARRLRRRNRAPGGRRCRHRGCHGQMNVRSTQPRDIWAPSRALSRWIGSSPPSRAMPRSIASDSPSCPGGSARTRPSGDGGLLRTHSMHPPSGQHGVHVLEESLVIEQGGHRGVATPPLDCSFAEVQTRPRKGQGVSEGGHEPYVHGL